MESWKKVFGFIFWGLVVVGCNTVATPGVTTTPSATKTPAATTTPEFTKTSQPTKTASPTVQVTPTFAPEIQAEVATLEAIVTENPELIYDKSCIIYGFCAYVSNLGLSPDKKWAVFFSTKEGTGGLSLVNVDSQKQWDIYYADIEPGLQGDVWVEIEHWSHDGRYLYVSPYMAADGGDGWFWRSYIRLIRINLENGTWVDTQMGPSFSFSPNDRYIAYRRGQFVVVHEFQTGKEQTFILPPEYVVFGRFLWSQDSKRIVFVSSVVEELLTDEAGGKPKGFSMFLLNMDDMSVRTILEKDERYLYPVEWQTPSLVVLEGLYTVSSDGTLEFGGKKYLLDLETNDISLLP